MKTEHYWESRPAEMSGPGSRGGGDRVKACSHPRGAEWRHWACPLVSNNLPPPRISWGRNGCQQHRAGSHQSIACVGPPCLASRWLGSRPEASPAPPARHWGIRKGLLALPKEAMVAGRQDGGLPCQGSGHPGGRQAWGTYHSCPAPIPSIGFPQAVMGPRTPGTKCETL